MMIRRELSEIRGTEMLFIDVFGHDVKQPSPCEHNVDQYHDVCLFAASLEKRISRGQISLSANEDSCSIKNY